jgi:serine/threonine protein phosphatase PrpC
MPVCSVAKTHPGLCRDSNEDSVVARPNLGFWVVCDGMGGHAAGDVASRVASEAIEGFLEDTNRVDARLYTWPFGLDAALGVDGTRLDTAFRLANRAIDIRIKDDPALTSMATTAVALLLERSPGSSGWSPGSSDPGSKDPGLHVSGDPGLHVPALIAHVGDSRAYLWRAGVLTRLTRDHSWVEEQIALGELSETEARTHPWRHMVTRAIAGNDDPRPDISRLVLLDADRVVLCSDGLPTVVSDTLIAETIGRADRGQVDQVAAALIDAANAAGGPDNITVAVVEIAC